MPPGRSPVGHSRGPGFAGGVARWRRRGGRAGAAGAPASWRRGVRRAIGPPRRNTAGHPARVRRTAPRIPPLGRCAAGHAGAPAPVGAV